MDLNFGIMQNFKDDMEAAYRTSRRGDMMRDAAQGRSAQEGRRSRSEGPAMPGGEYYGRSTEPKRQTMDGNQPAGLSAVPPVRNFCGKGPKNYKRSDERIHELICEKLTDDHELDASDIEVEVKNAEVVLSGEVREKFEKYRAEDLVESIGGISHIENRIKVQKRQMV